MSTVEYDLAEYEAEMDRGSREAEAHEDAGEESCEGCERWFPADEVVESGDRYLCLECLPEVEECDE